MSLAIIREEHWSAIVRVQAEAYTDIVPESLETLRSKWLRSPSLCFVYQAQDEVLAYLLAHAWHSQTPPKLYETLSGGSDGGDILFLHDLAVGRAGAGKGIGRQMVQHLLGLAAAQNFQHMLLVAVQNSVPFWEQFGFTPVANSQPSRSYGADARLLSRPLNA